MTDDVQLWNRLADLLPEAEAEAVKDCWLIGEQEAGLDLLLSGLLAHEVPISEAVRAQISVIAEAWGEREFFEVRILQCHGDGGEGGVKLIAPTDGRVDELPDSRSDLIPVPWIACTSCGRILTRAHEWEPWGALSYLADHYAITAPDGVTVLRTFPDDAVGDAFADLLNACEKP